MTEKNENTTSGIITRQGFSFNVWIAPMKSTFGNFAWGITAMTTGEGVGGFADTPEQARDAIEQAIRAAIG